MNSSRKKNKSASSQPVSTASASDSGTQGAKSKGKKSDAPQRPVKQRKSNEPSLESRINALEIEVAALKKTLGKYKVKRKPGPKTRSGYIRFCADKHVISYATSLMNIYIAAHPGVRKNIMPYKAQLWSSKDPQWVKLRQHYINENRLEQISNAKSVTEENDEVGEEDIEF